MATFTSAPAFAAHIGQYGERIKGANRNATKAAAEAAGAAIRRSGSRYRLRGRTGNRFALGARVEGPYGYGGNFYAYVKADPAGMWKLVEEGARPHVIRPRGAGRGRRRGRGAVASRKALNVPGYGYFAKVDHPGTGPIGHPWRDGLAVANRVGPQAYQQVLLSSAFGRAA